MIACLGCEIPAMEHGRAAPKALTKTFTERGV